MYRPHVMLVSLAAVLLAVGALSVTSADRVAGQSTTPEASATSEDFTVAPLSTPINNTGCEKNANNPHIAVQDPVPRRAKGFGEINCNSKKDELYVRTVLWKKGNDGDTTWSVADFDVRSCTTCLHTGIAAEKACGNRNSNLFQTVAKVAVYNNGNTYPDTGESQVVTLNCGGF